MRTCTLLITIFLSFTAFSQDSYWKFNVSYSEDGVSETTTLEAYGTKGKYYAKEETAEGTYEAVVVDSTLDSMLFLLSDEFSKIATMGSLGLKGSDDSAGYAEEPDMTEGEDYRFLPETKVIKGLNCQKIALLENMQVIGYGWVALQVQQNFAESEGFFSLHLPAGTIVDLHAETEGRQLAVTLADYTIHPVFPKDLFLLQIPAGFEDHSY